MNTPSDKRKLSSNSSGLSPSLSHVHKKQNLSLNSSQSSSHDQMDPGFSGFSAGFTTGQGLLSQSLQSKIASITRNMDPVPGVRGPLGSMDPPLFHNASTPRPQYQPPPNPGYPGYPGHVGADGHPSAGGPINAPPGISDTDVMRIAMAVRTMMAAEMQTIVTNLVECIDTLAGENKKLRFRIDELEMYSRRSCVRIFGVSEEKTNTDDAVMEIANALEVPLDKSDLAVSHRVGKKQEDRARPIIARITNYQVRHDLIKGSKNLPEIKDFEKVSVNQELTKTRAKLAYQCRELVRKKFAKASFVWDGKIFVIDNKENKHLVLHLDHLIELRKAVGCVVDCDE